MRKKGPEKAPSNDRYMLTYSDLITLLMIFFIVLYSFSNVDAQKYQQIAKSLNTAMGSGTSNGSGSGSGSASGSGLLNGGPTIAGKSNGSGDSNLPLDSSSVEFEELKGLKEKLDSMINVAGLKDSVNTAVEDRGLVISIKNALLFDSGKADIRPEYQSKIADIAKILKGINNYIIVEGNTDDVPTGNTEYKDNWFLASTRAINVMELMVNDSGIPSGKISARTNGEYRPVASNSTSEGRALNRRVDIIILNTDYNAVENSSKK